MPIARPPPASQKHLLSVQKAAADPFSQSLPESLLGILQTCCRKSDWLWFVFFRELRRLLIRSGRLFNFRRCREKLWRRSLWLDKIQREHPVQGDFSTQLVSHYNMYRLCLTQGYSRHRQQALIQRRSISGFCVCVCLKVCDSKIFVFDQFPPRQMNKFHSSSTASRQGSIDKVIIETWP